jgi:hypothetical protein
MFKKSILHVPLSLNKSVNNFCIVPWQFPPVPAGFGQPKKKKQLNNRRQIILVVTSFAANFPHAGKPKVELSIGLRALKFCETQNPLYIFVFKLI